MPIIKNLFGFRKNKGLDKSIIQTNPYKNNIDLNKRQFMKKGLLGLAGLGGLALASKVAKAGGLVFNDGSGLVAASSAVGTENLLINGAFTVSQIHGLFQDVTTAPDRPANNDDTILMDMWRLLSDGNNIVDVQQVNSIFDGFYNAIRLDVETASKKFGIVQIIETRIAKRVIDDVCSLSFDAKVTSASAGRLDNIKAVVLSWDSTADSVTSDVVSSWGAEDTTPTWAANWTAENTPANLSVTTSQARYSIENISIDTASTTNIAVFIWADGLTGTVTDTLEITGVKLEPGASATAAILEDPATELAKCQRYLYVVGGFSTDVVVGHGIANGATTSIFQLDIPTMRIEPVLLPAVPTPSNWNSGDRVSTSYNISAISIDSASTSNTTVFINTTNAGTQTAQDPHFLQSNGTTNARIILDANL